MEHMRPAASNNDNNVQQAREVDEIDHVPIRSIEEMECFEAKLADEDFRKKLKSQWFAKLGTNIGRGLSRKQVAYDLADLMFTRDVFLICSWTGHTLDTASFPNGKAAFDSFERIKRLFREIVHNADESFDAVTSKDFL